ncbi:MAG TPA: hypothetical protein VIK14_01690 [Ignavibacteria bacterium]
MQNLLLKKRAPDVTAILFIVAAVFLIFQNLLKGQIIATNDIGTNDLLYFSFPIRYLYSEALKAGELLQWTPFITSGFPVFAEGQNGFTYPFNLITCYLLDPFQAMNWFLIFHAILAGTGVYFFVKKISGSGWNAIPMAVAASVCGSFTTGHTRHLNIFAVIALTPWLFLFAESYVRKLKTSSALLFGSVLGLMLLTNHPQFSFICGFISILYLFLRFYFSEIKLPVYWKKILLFLLLAMVVSIAMSYYQLRETLELSSFSRRSMDLNTPEYTGIGSLPWNGLLTFIYPYYTGNAGNATYKSDTVYLFWEYFHYIGLVLLALAFIGLVRKFKSNIYAKIFFIIAIVSFLFALGENLKLYRIFSVFPVISAFRFPSRWLIGTELSLIFISVFGLQFIIDKIPGVKKSLQNKGSAKGRSKPQTANSSGKLKKLILDKPYLPGIVLSVIVILDIYIITGKGVATSSPEVFFPKNNNIISSLNTGEYRREFTAGEVELCTKLYQKNKGWEGDKSAYGIAANILPPNLAAYYHIKSVSGYINLTPHYYYEVWGDQDHPGIVRKTATSPDGKSLRTTPPFIKLSGMWGVKDFFTFYTMPEPFIVKSDTLGIKHYELPEIYPRAWIVKDIITTPADNKKSAELLIDEKFNPLEKAIVNGETPQLPSGSENSKAEILEEKNHSLKIKASAPGLVVISDMWYPRWKARINNEDTKVYRINNSMRGVISPFAGAEIEMYYDEGNIKAFLLLSLLTLAGVFGFGTFDYFRSGKNKNENRSEKTQRII